MFLVAPVSALISYLSVERTTRSPRQEGVSISSDIVFDALDMAENVSEKLDCFMQSLESLISSKGLNDSEHRVKSQQARC